MGRIPCCEKDNVKRGQWTPEEDNKLASYIAQHGTRNWRLIPKNAGLQRCGKSCRLRWTNYLRPDLNHGQFSEAEEHTIVKYHSVLGNRWSLIAAQLPGRTDNDVKNYWNTKLKKKLSGMGIDPVTHKPFSHLMAEITTTLNSPHVSHLAEAALGCFKDEMLHLLTKKRVDFNLINFSNPNPNPNPNPNHTSANVNVECSELGMEGKIKVDVLDPVAMKLWDDGSNEFGRISMNGFSYGSSSSFGNEEGNGGSGSPGGTEAWRSHGGATVAVGPKMEEEIGSESGMKGEQMMMMMRNNVFNVDSVLWDIQTDDDLLNQMV